MTKYDLKMHSKNIPEIFVYNHDIQFQATRYASLMRISLATVELQKQFRFLAHLDFLPPRLNTSTKRRADWSTVGRKVNLNNAEIFTVVRPRDDNLFRVNGCSVELRHMVDYSIIAYTKLLGTSLLQVQFNRLSYNAITDCSYFPPEQSSP